MRPALQRGLPLKLSQLSGIAVLQPSSSQRAPSNRASYLDVATSLQKGSVLISASARLAEAETPFKRRKMGAVDGPLAGLEPANVWGFFHDLSKIPRPSKHEEKCAPSLPPHICLHAQSFHKKTSPINKALACCQGANVCNMWRKVCAA